MASLARCPPQLGPPPHRSAPTSLGPACLLLWRPQGAAVLFKARARAVQPRDGAEQGPLGVGGRACCAPGGGCGARRPLTRRRGALRRTRARAGSVDARRPAGASRLRCCGLSSSAAGRRVGANPTWGGSPGRRPAAPLAAPARRRGLPSAASLGVVQPQRHVLRVTSGRPRARRRRLPLTAPDAGVARLLGHLWAWRVRGGRSRRCLQCAGARDSAAPTRVSLGLPCPCVEKS